jgi:hypothetical protein
VLCDGVVEGEAEIGFSSNCTKNNFRSPAGVHLLWQEDPDAGS